MAGPNTSAVPSGLVAPDDIVDADTCAEENRSSSTAPLPLVGATSSSSSTSTSIPNPFRDGSVKVNHSPSSSNPSGPSNPFRDGRVKIHFDLSPEIKKENIMSELQGKKMSNKAMKAARVSSNQSNDGTPAPSMKAASTLPFSARLAAADGSTVSHHVARNNPDPTQPTGSRRAATGAGNDRTPSPILTQSPTGMQGRMALDFGLVVPTAPDASLLSARDASLLSARTGPATAPTSAPTSSHAAYAASNGSRTSRALSSSTPTKKTPPKKHSGGAGESDDEEFEPGPVDPASEPTVSTAPRGRRTRASIAFAPSPARQWTKNILANTQSVNPAALGPATAAPEPGKERIATIYNPLAATNPIRIYVMGSDPSYVEPQPLQWDPAHQAQWEVNKAEAIRNALARIKQEGGRAPAKKTRSQKGPVWYLEWGRYAGETRGRMSWILYQQIDD